MGWEKAARVEQPRRPKRGLQGLAGDPYDKKRVPVLGRSRVGNSWFASIGPLAARWLTVSSVLPFPGFGLERKDFELSGFVSKWVGKRPQV